MFWKKKQPAPVAEPKGLFATHPLGPLIEAPSLPVIVQPTKAPSVASDSKFTDSINPAQLGFFAAGSGFIGYQACALLATHWLVDRACSMPSRDAIRQGYLLEDNLKDLRNTDSRYRVNENLRELINFGRVYGGRIVLFNVASENPTEYYSNPFNIDGVAPGTYRGMSQIDPNWVTPVLTEANLRDPASPDYYRPTFWRVGDRIYHHTHLHLYVPYPVPDYLKPTYNYLGVSVPQRIMERVYAAERSANEGPQLLMTKRLISINVSAAAMGSPETLRKSLEEWSQLMNNYGIKVTGPGESVQTFDTALGDVDTVIMTQYQLVASGCGVPATKLLGTSPKGWNASGDYEQSVYREDLESIQTNDLSPLLSRHYALVAKSLGREVPAVDIQWAPLDSPSATEWATIDSAKATRDQALFNTGAIDAEDIRNRIRSDRDSDYFGIEEGTLNGEETGNQETSGLGGAAGNGAVQGLTPGVPPLSGGEVS